MMKLMFLVDEPDKKGIWLVGENNREDFFNKALEFISDTQIETHHCKDEKNSGCWYLILLQQNIIFKSIAADICQRLLYRAY